MLLDALGPGRKLQRGPGDGGLCRGDGADHGGPGVAAEGVLQDPGQFGVAVGQVVGGGALAQLANDLKKDN